MSCNNEYDIGQSVKVAATIRDNTGALADPSNLYFKVGRPDGTSTIYQYLVDAEVVRASLGVYYLLYTTTMAGNHWYAYWVTGAQAVYEEASFRVVPRRC